MKIEQNCLECESARSEVAQLNSVVRELQSGLMASELERDLVTKEKNNIAAELGALRLIMEIATTEKD